MNSEFEQHQQPLQPQRKKRPWTGIILICAGLLLAANQLIPGHFSEWMSFTGITFWSSVLLVIGGWFFYREWSRRSGGKYRIGRYSVSAAFVLFGVLLIIDTAIGSDTWHWVTVYWPVFLVCYGVEALLIHRTEVTSRLDIRGPILLLLSAIIITGTSFIGNLPFSFDRHSAYMQQGNTIEFQNQVITAVLIEGGVGDIHVEPSSDEKITITPTYHSKKQQSLRDLESENELETDVDGNKLNVSLDQTQYSHFSLSSLQASSVDLDIRMPASFSLEVHADVGDVTVRHMQHIKEIETNTGRIILEDAKGNAKLQTDVGDMEVTDFRGSLQASVNVGKLTVTGVPDGDWKLSTDIGDVTAYIPKDGSYQYDFSADVGSVNVPGDLMTDKHKGTLNGGAHELKASTNVGAVHINWK